MYWCHGISTGSMFSWASWQSGSPYTASIQYPSTSSFLSYRPHNFSVGIPWLAVFDSILCRYLIRGQHARTLIVPMRRLYVASYQSLILNTLRGSIPKRDCLLSQWHHPHPRKEGEVSAIADSDQEDHSRFLIEIKMLSTFPSLVGVFFYLTIYSH